MNIAVEWPCLNGYRLLQQVYAGSKTVVYRALREVDQQSVAIKFLQPEMVSLNDLLHLRNHHAITQDLHLPHIIQTYDLEPYGHSYALVMEDFDGLSLRDYAQGQPLALEVVLKIAIALTDVLHSLYQHRIIHKDIQPANILIHPDTHQLKLTDFSLASRFAQDHQTLTNPQSIEGSLAYLAPEQTGRMHRSIDYRADFYALGVTLFELLTGRLPFLTTDPMELVHCHIAQPPPRLQEFTIQNFLREGQASTPFNIPQPVSDLVLKLMAKNADDRYQSALSLKHDLKICLTQWQAKGAIDAFTLGQQDKCDRFTLPQKLYGRDPEIATLLAAFERVSGRLPLNASLTPPRSVTSPPKHHPHSELILIAGNAGVGKTAIVQELRQPRARSDQIVRPQRGYFIQGKFDQLQRNIPFSAFVQAFRSLVSQLLNTSSEQLHQWKAKILQAIGESGAVLVDVIPELERIVGHQPAVPELAGTAAQTRFNRLIQRFVQVFATPHHPLVIFLDDLQWADSASLTLLQLLLSEGQNSHLLLIGAYRDQDVSSTHALTLALATLQQAQAPIQTITLLPLTLDALNQMVADTLGCSSEAAAPLTERIYQKTQGNPFFAIQFLKFLHQEGLIRFNPEIGHWQCDMSAIRSAALTEDVVVLMTQQLQTLPAHTQRILQLAACLGNLFTLETLALIAEQPTQNIAATLRQPLERGMIIPHNTHDQVYLGNDPAPKLPEDSATVTEPSPDNTAYQFLHDRIQQAAYALIPTEEKPSIHLKIGRLLLHHYPTTDPDSPLFEIASHLNAGSSQIADVQERDALAHLNLQAGQRAKASTAFTTALDYLRVGLTLLPHNSWQTHYGLTLALHQELAETAYLTGDFESMDRWIEAVLQQASSLLDQVKVYEVKIQAHMARNQMRTALQLGLQVLGNLGMSLPEEPSPADMMAAMQQAEAVLAGKSVTELLNLPTMTDPVQLATARINARLNATAYLIAPNLCPLLVVQQILRSVQYGNTAATASTYASYGALLNSLTNDIGRSYALGQLSLQLLTRFKAKALQAKTYFIFYVLVHHWQAPLADTLAPLLEGYQVGLETGDLEFAAYCLDHHLANAYFLGKALSPLAVEVAVFRVAMQDLHQESPYNYSGFYHQAILNLLGQSSEPSVLVGHACDEKVALSLCQQRGESTGLFFLYLHKLILCYLFGHHHQALDVARCAEPYITDVPGAVVIVLHNFYASLAYLAIYEDCDAYRDPQGNRLTPSVIQQTVAQNQAKLEFWARHAPMNYQHKFELVEAERHRVLGDRLMAMEWYDRAITTAKLAGFIQDEALANELAACFYLAWGKANIAQLYLTEAYQAYAQWGAKAKTDALAQRYPQLLPQVLLPPTGLGSEQAADLSHLASHSLDFEAILNATQSISEEIVLDQLLTKVMQVVLKTAGATKGVLLLLRQDQWERAALAQSVTQPIKLMTLPHPQMDEFWPQTLVNHVCHSQTALILDYPHSQVLFAQDGYWQIQAPAAVLGLPVLKQGILMGVLYLENQFAVGAFTRDRISVLHLVCTQAAISLENARLYQQARSYARQLETSLKALSASESRLKTLSDNIPGVIVRIHVKAEDGSDSITYISSGCYDLYEVTAETIMAGYRTLRSFEHPDDQAKITASIHHSATHLTPFREEFRIITPSGQLKWIQVTAQPKQFDKGDIVWDGLLFDISDRKSAAEQLQHQAEQLAQANQQLENYSHTLEARVDERTQELSQALAHLQSAQQDLIHSEKMAALGQLTASIAHEINTPLGVIRGATSNIVAAFTASLRQLPTLLQRLSPEQQSAFLILIEVALHTEQSLSTKEERQLRRQIQTALDQQGIPEAAAIATQLTLLRCGTDLTPYQPLICDRTCPEILQAAYNLVQQYHSTQSIQQEVDRAAKIVFALKTYSHHHQTDELESIDIIDSLEVALTLYQNRFKQGISVLRQYAADLPKLLGHPNELTQVWINLIDNAVYAMGSEGTLEIAVAPSADHIQIAITDSGCGIPPALQTQIFTPFFTTKPRGEGSGLGLDIVHQIIQNHQGQIQVQSQPPRTTFTICLPLTHRASPPPSSPLP